MANFEFMNADHGLGGSGSGLKAFVWTVSAQAFAANDVAVFGPISGELVPMSLSVQTDGVSGVTVDLGLYLGSEKNYEVVDDNVLDDNLDIGTTGIKTGLTAIAVGDADKTFRDLVDSSNLVKIGNPLEFVLGMKANGVIADTETLVIKMICAEK